MLTKFIEATNGPRNHGKFMLGRFTYEDWEQRSAVDGYPIVGGRGWTAGHLLVFDLQTGEGAIFLPGGYAHADLEKHRVWVCPLFEPFLTWLYTQDLSDLDALPTLVDLPDAPFSMSGHRRPGPDAAPAKATDEQVIAAREVLKGHVPEGVMGDYLRPAIQAALEAA